MEGRGFRVKGILHKVFPAEQKTENFRLREFVLRIDRGTFTNYIAFRLSQDRCSLIDSFEEGEMVQVFFDIYGKEWNGRYFNNLNAWRIERVETFPDTGVDDLPPLGEQAQPSEETTDADDDLPF